MIEMNALKEQEIFKKFLEMREVFPFGATYVEKHFPKYLSIAGTLFDLSLDNSQILSIGSGPCDLEALVSKLGFQVTAVDDLADQWHLLGKNRERIVNFARQEGIEFLLGSAEQLQLRENTYDAVLLIDVIEHLHTSPRELLNTAISCLKHEGFLIVETPNSAALAKRLKVLFGRSNQVDIKFVYWNVGQYRSHFREYTADELKAVVSFHNLKDVQLKMKNVKLEAFLQEAKSQNKHLSRIVYNLYRLPTALSPNFKDTIQVLARKPQDWRPTDESVSRFKQYYKHLDEFNLDSESDESIKSRILRSA